jgi:hypothetical protein
MLSRDLTWDFDTFEWWRYCLAMIDAGGILDGSFHAATLAAGP